MDSAGAPPFPSNAMFVQWMLEPSPSHCKENVFTCGCSYQCQLSFPASNPVGLGKPAGTWWRTFLLSLAEVMLSLRCVYSHSVGKLFGNSPDFCVGGPWSNTPQANLCNENCWNRQGIDKSGTSSNSKCVWWLRSKGDVFFGCIWGMQKATSSPK